MRPGQEEHAHTHRRDPGLASSDPKRLGRASGRHNEPSPRPASTGPAQPPSKAGGDSPRGGGRHHGDGKADQSTESDRTRRGAAHQRKATRHARYVGCALLLCHVAPLCCGLSCGITWLSRCIVVVRMLWRCVASCCVVSSGVVWRLGLRCVLARGLLCCRVVLYGCLLCPGVFVR